MVSDNKPQEQYQLSRFRIGVVLLVLLASFGFLTWNLLYIQVLEPEFLVKEGNERVLRNYSFEPARGVITDRMGKILAISVPVKLVGADPSQLHAAKVVHNPDLIRKIAALVGITPQKLFAQIQSPKRRYVKLNAYVPVDKAKELEALKVPGLLIEDNYMRYYPTGEVNATLVGLLSGEGAGVYGIEQSFNSYLSAQSSTRAAHKDIEGHIIENLGVLKEGKAGGNLMLSIDDRLQAIAYSALGTAVEQFGADSGCLVLLDVKTGEILSMVTVPSFDPNDRSVFDDDKARNRTVTDVLEPGSTLKPIVSLAALEQNMVSWNEVFDTRPFIVDGKMVRDSHAMDKGTLADILKYSSNTGMAHISLRTGPEPIMNMLKRFGFGERSSSGLVGEVSGSLRADRPFWSDIDKATLGFGYGVTVTPLQLASAYATLANDGGRVPVSILRLHQAPVPVQVANAAEVKRVKSVLETVVSGGGTGSKAAIDRYRIAGKTGTARIADKGGYSQRYMSTFAGFAPMSNPRFALVVTIRNPTKLSYYGGTVSGPAFKDVMTRALQLYNVAPDK
ncbi:MAG: penicillin-binding protein 2 [Proteobacteria bacterium]|uniref:Penicillin-binding protein 2 n=1 Tax=Candidatus Avisuccinivibrio stercorigallinarum TaxID=2840704 RepID=A0A9D9D8H6_9GAMM|nr:penicillin-binding protein 2 [Candidatus Avisuccinivibrio stercorigallinarum]